MTCEFDDFYLWREEGEPDVLISSITATHSGDRYSVTWSGPPGRSQTFEVRYSDTSMKPDQFESGKSGGTVRNRGDAYTSVNWEVPECPSSRTST